MALTLTVLVLSACTSTTGGTAADPGDSLETAAPSGTTGGSAPAADSVEAMLRLLPKLEYDADLQLTVNRWHAAAAAYGIDIPAADAGTAEVANYVISLPAMARTTSLTNAGYAQKWSTDEQFGYSRQSISVEAQMGPPPNDRGIAIGEFDLGAVTAATTSGPVGPDVQQIDVGGVPVLRWRDDFKVNQRQLNVLSAVGSSGRLAVPDPGTLLYSTYDRGIQDLIDVHQGRPSLADDSDVTALARLLDDRGVITARIEDGYEDGPLASIYLASGFFWDGEPEVVLAYQTPSEASASALAENLKSIFSGNIPGSDPKPWSTAIADLDVELDGPMAIATFTYLPGAYGWILLPYLLSVS